MEVQTWARHFFGPQVALLSSSCAEGLVAKSNLSLQELLHACSAVNFEPELVIGDGVNVRHNIVEWAVRFVDGRKLVQASNAEKRGSSDQLAKAAHQAVLRHAPEIGEEKEKWPWFDVYSACMLEQTLATQAQHECFSHVITTLLVISARELDPVGSARKLFETHSKDLVKANKLVSMAITDANNDSVLNQSLSNPCCYLVLCESGDDAKKVNDVFETLKAAFGKDECFLLTINSGAQDKRSDESESNVSFVAKMMMETNLHRFNPLWLRMREQQVDESDNAKKDVEEETKSESVSHPLAEHEDDVDSWPTESKSKEEPTSPVLLAANIRNIARYITQEDLRATRQFVQDLCRRHLAGLFQRQIRLLHDLVQSRKSRSLFSGAAKRWFNTRSASGNTLNSVIYSRDAVEMVNRRLADIYFIVQNYKAAFNIYHALKREFQGDEAWNYYAGSCEMSALSLFLQEASSTSKKFPSQYFEEAIHKYANVCSMPEFAFRATLFDALCLKQAKMYGEAAASFIRLTSDTLDLRSALLLEQAASCFLHSSCSLKRKFAFHIVLSGYRFAKANQRQHAIRAYYQGLSVMSHKKWTLAESHILFSLAHLSLLLKDYERSTKLFNNLISTYHVERHESGLKNDDVSFTSGMRYPSEQQQLTHLREFFMVHHVGEKENKNQRAELPLPKFEMQDCRLLSNNANHGDIVDDTLDKWLEMERVIVERVNGQEVLFLTKTWQNEMSSSTDNKLRMQILVNNKVKIMVPVRNVFTTQLVMDDLTPLYEFTQKSSGQVFTNDPELKDNTQRITDSNPKVEVDTLASSNIVLNPKKTEIVALSLKPKEEGDLKVIGVKYRLKALFKESNDVQYCINGKQYLSVKGPRLNVSKAHKTGVVYGKDCRLELIARDRLPLVKMSFLDSSDLVLGSGEVIVKTLRLINEGNCDAINIHLIHNCPGLLAFEKSEDVQFGFPLVSESTLNRRLEDGSEDNLNLEILKIPVKGLSSGQDIRLKVYFRGRQVEQIGSVKLICYAQAKDKSEKKLTDQYSLTTLNLNIKTTPTLKISLSRRDDDNKNKAVAVVNVGNCLETNVEVTEVYVISPHSTFTKCFVVKNSGEKGSLAKISPNASTAFVLALNNETENNLDQLNFSACGTNLSTWPLHQHPYKTFLKPHLEQNASIPRLTKTVVILVWRDGDEKRSGVHLSDIDLDASYKANRASLTLKAEQKEFWHDFEVSPLANVPFFLDIFNEEDKEVDLALTNLDKNEEMDHVIEGCTDQTLRLEAKQMKRLKFSLAVTKPGVFVCRSLAFKNLSAKEQQWQRLEITLTIRSKLMGSKDRRILD